MVLNTEFQKPDSMGIILAVLTIGIIYGFARCVYLLYFHPLAKYPGPSTAALSDLWLLRSFSTGHHVHRILELHRKYGDVVRIGPNFLSFGSLTAFHDIYGPYTKGRKLMLKCAEYERPGDIATIRDPVAHANHRKALLGVMPLFQKLAMSNPDFESLQAHGFSTAGLRDQEHLFRGYCDLFIENISKLGGRGQKALKVEDLFNWLTFDTIGDLSFGEPFNALADASNDWVSLISASTRYSAVIFMKRNMPIIANLLAPLLFPKELRDKHEAHARLSREKARKRIAMGNSLNRQDFFGHLIQQNKITEDELMADAQTMIEAGTMTTATALTATTYFLLQNPDSMAKLTKEVRTSFTSSSDIKGDSTMRLEYLNGVVEEGLRLYPPLAVAVPRECPGAVIDGHFIPQGTIVVGNIYTVARDPRYFKDPEAFRPERWIGDSGDEKKASMPFSTGPRACIGINMAYMEIRVAIAKMVYEYDLELVSKDIGDWNRASKVYALWSMPELLVKFHPRGKI